MTNLKSLLIGIMLIIPHYTQADEAANAAAERLLEVTDMENVLNMSIDQMMQLQVQANPALAQYSDVIREFLAKHMSYESIKPEFVALYTNAFTANELDEIVDFYHTSTGQKALLKLPEIMQKGGQIGLRRVQENQEELKALIEARAAEIKAETEGSN